MSPETYWKRRVFVLAGILVVVALIAYACSVSGSSSDDGNRAANVDPSPDSSTSPENSPAPTISVPSSSSDESSADGGGNGGGAGAGGGGSGSAGGSEGGGGSGSGGDAAAAADDGEEIPAPQQPEDPCRPEDVVVTVSLDQDDYAAGEQPVITLDVVNTAKQTCTVDLGPAAMEVRITSGPDRIFSTADCQEQTKSSGSRETQLRYGVPETVTITWDRKRSWEDCRDDEVAARAGTYIATLYSQYDQGAERQVFRLN
ncbi:hypothetical protein [Salinactinospora qingdaonensis]|uniref:hypothetical protein n=1 Tax=Salinactinospora qingdaonensis TaxID=702744 RepID=UPI0031E8CCA3